MYIMGRMPVIIDEDVETQIHHIQKILVDIGGGVIILT